MDFSKLVQRVTALLRSPKTEWPVIAAEPATVADLYKGYVAILAAIPAVCGFFKFGVIGVGMATFGTYRVDMGTAATHMIVSYVLSLAAVYLVALIIDALAPTFGGQKDRVQALKTAAYSYTASWVAGFGFLLPWIGMLIVIAGAIYSIYLLYLALPHTMKAPAERAAGYTALTVVVAILLGWLIAMATGSLLGRTPGGSAHMGASQSEGSFDEDNALGKLEAWGEKMEEAAEQMEQAHESGDAKAKDEAFGSLLSTAIGIGGAELVSPERLRSFVPEELGGLRYSPAGPRFGTRSRTIAAMSGPARKAIASCTRNGTP